jgi:hypothetical protein
MLCSKEEGRVNNELISTYHVMGVFAFGGITNAHENTSINAQILGFVSYQYCPLQDLKTFCIPHKLNNKYSECPPD